MLFLFKKKTIHLDCFTNRNDVYTLFPIVKTLKCLPDWWKNLEQSHIKQNGEVKLTMKHCSGFIDFFRQGVSLPLWSDLYISLGETPIEGVSWNFADGINRLSSHPNEQFSGFSDNCEMIQHIKIDTPWLFESKDDLKWLISPNPWCTEKIDKISILPGVLNFKYMNEPNINGLVIYNNTQRSFIIETGTPLMNIIPISESKVIIHNHLISNDEYDRKRLGKSPRAFFLNKYNKTLKIVKKRESEKKCPFGFGN